MAEPSMLLSAIEERQDEMTERVRGWCEINTGSYNVNGLDDQCQQLQSAFGQLDVEVDRHSLPPNQIMNDDGEIEERELGDLLLARCRPDAERSVLLGGHMDTVFPADSPFQDVRKKGTNRLVGPGVTDDKGGLVIMLTALDVFEQMDESDSIGWEVFINPDEELGSPSSSEIIRERALEHDIGLVFEPTMPDGSMVTDRKASGDFSFRIEGKSAHAGRNPDQGADAIKTLSSMVMSLHQLDEQKEGIICNVGRVIGGGAVNVVPDRAVAHVNIRVDTRQDQQLAEVFIEELVEDANRRDGITVTTHGDFKAPPKPFEGANRDLYETVVGIASELGLPTNGVSSGGICDGNHLWAAGLPNVDTMGPVGGEIHTHDEYLKIDSLTQRAKLAALVLFRFADEQFNHPEREDQA